MVFQPVHSTPPHSLSRSYRGRSVNQLACEQSTASTYQDTKRVLENCEGALEMSEDLMSFAIGDTVTVKRLMPRAPE